MIQRVVINALELLRQRDRLAYKFGFAAGLSISSALCWSSQAQAANGQGFAQWPDDCHAQSSVENALRKDIAVPPMYGARLGYLKQVRKYDVVCVGQQLVVDTPIFTNGGDVVIFADDVRIAAPIRTAIGRPDVFDQIFLDPYTGLPGSHNQGRASYMNVIYVIRSSGLPGTRAMEQTYRDYYNCSDGMEFQSQPICFDRPTGFTHPFFNWALTERHFEMGYRQHDGVPAPDEYIDETVYRSGSVFIFAQKITFEGSGELNVAGNKGSVGGLGQPPGCIGPADEGETSCLGYGLGAQSAPGGRGGDAGDIFLYGMAGKPLTGNSSSKLLHSGGASGPATLRRSPRGEQAHFSGNLDGDFPIEGYDQSPAIGGADGALVSRPIGTDVAMELLVTIAKARDALIQYDVLELSQRAEADSSVIATGWVDYISQKAADLIRNEQTEVVDAALAAFLSPSSLRSAAAPSLICPGKPLGDSQPARLRNMIARAAPYCGQASNKFAHFIDNTGGLLRIEDRDTGQTIVLESIRLLLSENSETLQGIRVDLASIHEQLLNIYTTVERASVQDELGRLQNEIESVDAALAQQNDSPSKLESIVRVASEVGALHLAARSFAAVINDSNAGGQKFRESGRALASAIGSTKAIFVDALSRSGDPQNEEGLQGRRTALDNEVVRLNVAIEEFLAAQSRRIEKVRGLRMERLHDALGARARREAVGAEINRHFENVLKRSILSFLLDRSQNRESLRTNLLTLRALTTHPGGQAFSFAFPALPSPCQGTSPDPGACITLEYDAPITILTSASNDQALRIALYVVRVGKRGDKLSSFGLTNVEQFPLGDRRSHDIPIWSIALLGIVAISLVTFVVYRVRTKKAHTSHLTN